MVSALKWISPNFSEIFSCTVCYTILNFLPSSLIKIVHVPTLGVVFSFSAISFALVKVSQQSLGEMR